MLHIFYRDRGNLSLLIIAFLPLIVLRLEPINLRPKFGKLGGIPAPITPELFVVDPDGRAPAVDQLSKKFRQRLVGNKRADDSGESGE